MLFLSWGDLDEVRMWVFEETLPSGEKLSEVINRTNVIPLFTLVLIRNLCFSNMEINILTGWFLFFTGEC